MQNELKQKWIDQIFAEHKRDGFQSARADFKSTKGNLWITYRQHDCRARAVKKMVQEAYYKSKKPDFDFLVSHDDIPYGTYVKKYFVFSTIPRHGSQTPEEYENTVPDYTFDSLNLYLKHKIENGDCSYSELVRKIEKAGLEEPETDKLGWIGHLGCHARTVMFEKIKKLPYSDFCDFIWTNHYMPDQPYLTFDQQVKKWRFIFDIQGFGEWTDRLKHFFFSNRVIFYVERPNGKEFYFKDLVPWDHFVPVKPDLSDLHENYMKVLNDKNLEDHIRFNAKKFALSNLEYHHAIQNYINKIDHTDWSKHSVDISKLEIKQNSSLSEIPSNSYGEIVFEESIL